MADFDKEMRERSWLPETFVLFLNKWSRSTATNKASEHSDKIKKRAQQRKKATKKQKHTIRCN